MPYNIQTDIILPKIKAANRKQVFEILAGEIAKKIHLDKKQLIGALIEKEIKSSSGTGDGVAIPHLKLPGLQGRFIALVTLKDGVDFKAVDDKPVDIVCLLLSPEEDLLHLRGLSRISRMFKNKDLCQRLRETDDIIVIEALFDNPEEWSIAA